jgi:phospholipid/cholesterol/gamma-HCH transport system substrate-binding protein
MKKGIAGAKLGIFIFLGSVLLVIGIFMLGNKEALFKDTYTVKAYFNNIEGLRNGAPVRLSGIDVGAVKEIRIIGDTVSVLEVSMRLLTEIERFIRKDTYAEIQTEGLVGNKIVSLKMGDSKAEQVEDGGTILSREPVSFADIIEETQGIMGYTKEMTKDLSEIINKVNTGDGTIGKLLNDDSLYYAAANLTETADRSLLSITSELNIVTQQFNKLGEGIESVVTHVNNVVARLDTLLLGVSEGKGVIGSLLTEGSPQDSSITAILTSLHEVTEQSNIAASRLAENMEALKHNWLFKSYFEERGYWDANEYEQVLDEKTKELNEKIELLDEKIEELKTLEARNE